MAHGKHGFSREGTRFDERVVLVTGAASGLGRGIAIAFAEAGSDLVLVDLDGEGLSRTAEIVESLGGRCMTRIVDVSSREGMEALAEEVLSARGRVDVLVNNAGVGVGGELKDIPLDDMEWIVGINLMGEIYGTGLFLPGMLERGEGHIVNVASLSGLVLLPFHIAYTTTKFGITGFSKALWAETRRHGVGVTLVCPGPVKTNIMAGTRMHYQNRRQERAHRRYSDMLKNRGLEAEEAGKRVVEAVARDRFLLITGFLPRLLYYLTRLCPGLMMRLVSRVAGAVTGQRAPGGLSRIHDSGENG